MTNISALDALNAALAASDTVKEQAAASNDTTIDFSSYLKSSKNLDEIYQEAGTDAAYACNCCRTWRNRCL